LDLKKLNISFFDIILNYLSLLKWIKNFTKVRTFLTYRILYSNYLNVIMHVFANKYPINVIIRNGTTITFRNYLELQVYDGRDKGFEYDIPNDSVTLTEHFFGNMDVITIYGLIKYIRTSL
jgi:hypothetical protein